jgi:hypothetical protein
MSDSMISASGPRCKHGIRGDCAVCEADALHEALDRAGDREARREGGRPWLTLDGSSE